MQASSLQALPPSGSGNAFLTQCPSFVFEAILRARFNGRTVPPEVNESDRIIATDPRLKGCHFSCDSEKWINHVCISAHISESASWEASQLILNFNRIEGIESIAPFGLGSHMDDSVSLFLSDRRIVRLDIQGSPNVSDQGFWEVERSALNRLSVVGTSITDKTVLRISQNPSITRLDLRENLITDRSIASFERMRSLRDLILSRQSFSELGLKRLRLLGDKTNITIV